MWQPKLDGLWLYCSALAASQLGAGIIRLHHEDSIGAAIQSVQLILCVESDFIFIDFGRMTSGIICLLSLRFFHKWVARLSVRPLVALTLLLEIQQTYGAIAYGPNSRTIGRLFVNLATLWSCVTSFWFLEMWKCLMHEHFGDDSGPQPAIKEARKVESESDDDEQTNENSAQETTMDSVIAHDFLEHNEADFGDEPLLLCFESSPCLLSDG